MSTRAYTGRTVLLLCGLMAAHLAGAQESTYPELSLSTGLNYSRGDFGTDAEIEDLYVPLGFTATFENYAFRIKVPYLSVDTTSEGVTTTESGLGDVSLSLTAFNVLYSDDFDLALDITGSLKLGTADRDTGLGTGENDATIYFDGYKFFDDATVFGSIGHRWRGEPPDVAFNDVFLAMVGVTFATEGGGLVGATLDYRESAIAGFDDIQELQGFFIVPLGEAWDLEVYAFTGFTDSSPDWGAGFSIAADLRRLAFRRDR
jgi:hypothetical protein